MHGANMKIVCADLADLLILRVLIHFLYKAISRIFSNLWIHYRWTEW